MKIDSKQIWEEVKENHKKLDSCNKHDFSIDVTPAIKFGKKYKCSSCGGVVDGITKLWYEKGVEHGKASL